MITGTAYLWIKVVHLFAVIAWMAGLLYLPRLFVYHADAVKGGEASETFKVMERRLYKAIMMPAMLVALATGFLLAWASGWLQGWLHAKLGLVALLVVYQHFCAKWVKSFSEDANTKSARYYRIANEIPAVVLVLVLILVVVKPF